MKEGEPMHGRWVGVAPLGASEKRSRGRLGDGGFTVVTLDFGNKKVKKR